MKKNLTLLLLCCAYVLSAQTFVPTTTIMPWGSTWKWKNNSTDLGTAWYASGYNDAAFSSGPAPLGYGVVDAGYFGLVIPAQPVVTTIGSPGASGGTNTATFYFRSTFTLSTSSYSVVQFKLRVDDGCAIYINGQMVSTTMTKYATASSTNSTVATSAVALPFQLASSWTYTSITNAQTTDGQDLFTFTLSATNTLLVNGTNTIAVEVHNRSNDSSDILWAMQVEGGNIGTAPPPAPTIVKGPYLQVGTQNSMVVRWETNVATDSKVMYGASAASLNQVATNTVSSVTHTVQLSGLTPYTKYYYNIGSSTLITQGDTNNYFLTSPVPGTPGKYRFWVVGDCGNASTNQINCKNQFKTYNNNRVVNAMLLSGDNAYSSGLDAEYNAEFFGIYQNDVLKNMPLWSAPGNHDYNNGASTATTVPYFSNFMTPTAGEAGGIPSNTPAYYSFDYGNIHFLSLDSYGTVASQKMYDTTGAQTQWIKQDLAANNKKWVIAYWHHPPYTMGSHNSDSESDLAAIHQKFIKILERYGVDMIITGHSHDYERSKLINGHYGNEASFSAATHNLSSSSGNYDGTANSCPYTKDSVMNKIGTVYVVSGSAGQLGGQQGTFPHDAMHYSNATNGGTFILDIEDNKLDAKWICADGVVRDQFTMFKDVKAKKSYTVQPGQAQTLAASWPGAYAWGNAAATRTLAVSAISDTTIWVKDPNNCVADTFKLKVLPAVNFTMTTPYCASSPIAFTDLSTNNTTAWAWSVNPSTGVTINSATSKNPGITFNTAGTYTVSLIANNAYGAGTLITKTITVNAGPTVLASLSSTAICVNQSATLTASGAPSYSWSSGSTNTVITVSPVSNATYTLTGTDINGCKATSIKTLIVNALPVVSVTANPATASVCAGNTLILGGSGATTYNWTSPIVNAASFIPTANATYTVTGTNANGCQNTATVSVVVNANPTVSISGNTVICVGGTLTLAAAGASSYSWNTTATSTIITQNPVNSGTFVVTGTNAQGCSATASQPVVVNPLPVISVSSGVVCPGFSFTLNPGGASTYTYSGGSNVVTPLNNTSYSVTGTSSLGCVSSIAAVATVSVVNSLTVNIAGPASICLGQNLNLTASGAGTYTWNTGAVTSTLSQAPTVNTSYTVTGGTGSCTNTASYSVAINPLPSVSVSGNMILCAGQTTTITAAGATTYSWSNGNTGASLIIAPLAGYNYQVTGTDANGCKKSAATNFTVNSLPVLSASTNNSLICVGESATLSVAGAANYLWNTSASSSTVAISPIVTTSYSVTGTSANNCSASTSIIQNVNECTGIENGISAGKGTLVYPNPNKGTFNIELNTQGDFNADIFNALGERVYSAKLQSGLNNIHLEENKGIYFYIILDGTKTIETGKIIIE